MRAIDVTDAARRVAAKALVVLQKLWFPSSGGSYGTEVWLQNADKRTSWNGDGLSVVFLVHPPTQRLIIRAKFSDNLPNPFRGWSG